jgi:hypothetical protein
MKFLIKHGSKEHRREEMAIMSIYSLNAQPTAKETESITCESLDQRRTMTRFVKLPMNFPYYVQ